MSTRYFKLRCQEANSFSSPYSSGFLIFRIFTTTPSTSGRRSTDAPGLLPRPQAPGPLLSRPPVSQAFPFLSILTPNMDRCILYLDFGLSLPPTFPAFDPAAHGPSLAAVRAVPHHRHRRRRTPQWIPGATPQAPSTQNASVDPRFPLRRPMTFFMI